MRTEQEIEGKLWFLMFRLWELSKLKDAKPLRTNREAAALLSPGYQLAVTFAVMLAILLIRPHGLFGRAEARAV